MLRGHKYLWRLVCNTDFAGAGGNGLKSTRSGQDEESTLSFFRRVGSVAAPNLVATSPKGLFPKESRAKQNHQRKRRKSQEGSGDYCLEINGGVRSCDGSVNSNKSPVQMFVLMAAELDLRRVKVSANCLESQCF